MLSCVITQNVGIELKARALQIIVNAQIGPEVEQGGRDGDDDQGRGNEGHGGGNEK
jgi:hypothetical protein